MVDVSIIILNYKAREWVKKNLSALKESDEEMAKNGFTKEVFVVDNSDGGDGTCEMIRGEFPDYACIATRENIGFPKANNLAIRKSNGRYILLLNPDSLLEKNTLSEMIRYMDNNLSVGVATCKVELVATGEVDPASHRGFPTPWASLAYYLGFEKIFPKSKLFGGYHQTWKDLSKEHEIDACVGSFMFIRQKALADIGGECSEDYFMYAEDIDTCYRIKTKGWKIVYYPQVKVRHYKGFSTGIRKETQAGSKSTKEHRIRMINSFWDDNLVFYDKFFKKRYPFYVNWIVHVAVNLKKRLALFRMHI
ncbi:glycosyltransferase family 2 protein [candidate division WWE3 bacterium]|nr:glycosyltransferase family 2 protein [candidate division WWE3 bacterium]